MKKILSSTGFFIGGTFAAMLIGVGIIYGFIKLLIFIVPPAFRFFLTSVLWWWHQPDLLRFWILPAILLTLIICMAIIKAKIDDVF